MKYPGYETDNMLGAQVQILLREASLQGPTSLSESLHANDESKEKEIAELFRQIMNVIGLDTTDPVLRKAKYSIAEKYLKDLFWGLDYDRFPKVFLSKNKSDITEMVHFKIHFETTDERTFQPGTGKIFFAYIPDKYLINPDDLANVVSFLCSRPQNAARLCAQLLFTLKYILSCEDLSVAVKLMPEYVKKYKGKFALGSKYPYRNEFAQICQK